MREDEGDSELERAPPDKPSEEASMWLSRINRGLRPDEVAGLREIVQIVGDQQADE